MGGGDKKNKNNLYMFNNRCYQYTCIYIINFVYRFIYIYIYMYIYDEMFTRNNYSEFIFIIN